MTAEKHPIEKLQDMLKVPLFDRIVVKKNELDGITEYRAHICFQATNTVSNYAHLKAVFGIDSEIEFSLKRKVLDGIYGELRDTIFQMYIEVARNTKYPQYAEQLLEKAIAIMEGREQNANRRQGNI